MPLTKLGGRSEIRRLIASGAIDDVYEAHDLIAGRLVAVKTIKTEQRSANDVAELKARFDRELSISGNLNHPNIIAVYDAGSDPVPYLVMELALGVIHGDDIGVVEVLFVRVAQCA